MVRYKKEPIDFELYESRLAKRGYIWVDKKQLEEDEEQYLNESAVYGEMANDVMVQRSGGQFPFLVKGAIINYLQTIERCPRHYFQVKNSNSDSLDMKRCLTPLQQNGYAEEFIDYYSMHRTAKSKASNIRSILTTVSNGDEERKGIAPLRFRVVASPNFRYNYADVNIISQIPKRNTKCIVAPDDYCLVWGDFAQSDFRIAYNLFLRSEENDKVMLRYEDKYEALARIVDKSLGKEFDKEKFTEDRKLYKKLTLATIYGTRTSVIKKENEFISSFTAFLMKCPKYVEYYNTLADYYELNVPILIQTYFGNEQLSPILGSLEDTVFRALNCPVQSVTSEVVVMTVNKILEEFYNLGYTEDDVSVYLVRHDEPVFLVKKSALKDAWIFEQYRQIFVDGWSPLALDFSVGYRYGEEDAELMGAMKLSIEKNASRIDKLEETVAGENNYFPVKPVLRLQVSQYFVEGTAVFAVYNKTKHQVYYGMAKTDQIDDVILAVRKMLHEMIPKEEYQGIVVLNSNYEGEDYSKAGVHIRYRVAKSRELREGNLFAKYATCRFCKANGLNSPTNPPLASEADFIHSVTKFEELG